MKKTSLFGFANAMLLLLVPLTLVGQVQRDIAPLKPWPAPLFWQPTQTESRIATVAKVGALADAANDTIPANSLVFVGMTPCRVVDTRAGQGFPGAFGPPNLLGGASRTFPIQASMTCSIPAIAQAYSFNITIVPPGFVDFITVWPTGQPRPNVSTLNGYVNTVIANAAVVPAGTGGSVDVFASQNTDLIIDINGYYAPQSGLTLARGNAGDPSLSFAGDPGTGIYSSGAGTLNIATGGTNRLTVRPDGDVDLPGSIRKQGNLFLHNLGNHNTAVGLASLAVGEASFDNTAIGEGALSSNIGNDNTAIGTLALLSNLNGFNNTATGSTALQRNTIGVNDTAGGSAALANNITGHRNTATGAFALFENIAGSDNAADGLAALISNTGSNNTASGSLALSSNTTGNNNVAVGFRAGLTTNADNANITGSNNTFIGGSSGPGTSTELNNATAIGANAVVSADNALVLGDSSVSVGIGTSTPTAKLDVTGGVRLNKDNSGKPSCDATTRGTFWFTQGGAGVKDSAEVCAKDAANGFAWRTLY
jgi:hypothetical protein